MGAPKLLPRSCEGCVFHKASSGLRCHHRAPSPGDDELQIAHWRPIKPTDRCGAGAVFGNKDGLCITDCEDCVHWFVPEGGLKPGALWGKSREWWTEAGICTAISPSPGPDEKRHTFWPVTHARDGGCGDGEAAPDEEDAQMEEPPLYEPPPELEEATASGVGFPTRPE